MNLDNTRAAIGLEFQSFVQNICGVKTTDLIAQNHPDIHYNLKNLISRRNWLAHEYGTTAPVKWSDIADSVYNGLPSTYKRECNY